jgi:V/A-type H+-transporting ATPase subunit B
VNQSKGTFQYQTTYQIQGNLIFLRHIEDVAYEEIVKIYLDTGEVRKGQVLQADKDATIIQVFEGTENMETVNTKVVFSQDVFKIGVSKQMISRAMDGLGVPIDDLGTLIPEKLVPVTGSLINPVNRENPREVIETGISAIDGLNSLVQGQKLPIFTASGLPTSELAARIAIQSQLKGSERELAVIFVAMGITEMEWTFFRNMFERASTANIAFFSNFTSDSIVERLLTPRVALTFAEYLAFEHNFIILVILQDMLNYCEALREISAAREEFPGRRGYPGYLYTDLASLYERAGRLQDQEGSITLIPIVTMPNDDITHPVPDLTGFITEGQLVLSRDLYNRQIFPPLDPLPSLSRLMNAGIGTSKTREDHASVANQLYAAYAQGVQLRQLASIAGKESLSSRDQLYLEFADQFEHQFIHQGEERRPIEETLNLGWNLLTLIPKSSLNRIPLNYIDKYYPGD